MLGWWIYCAGCRGGGATVEDAVVAAEIDLEESGRRLIRLIGNLAIFWSAGFWSSIQKR